MKQESRKAGVEEQPRARLLPSGQSVKADNIENAERTSREGVHPGGRQANIKKLNELKVEYYEVPNALELSEVVKDIHRLARKLDPEKVGVNFVLSSQKENPGLLAVDPVTGLPPVSPPVGEATHEIQDCVNDAPGKIASERADKHAPNFRPA